MISRGVQAVLACNGLFTSNRSAEQVFERQELAYLRAGRQSWRVDEALGLVTVETLKGPVGRAAYRAGIGCVVMHPDQSVEEIDDLPVRAEVSGPETTADVPWPMGDAVGEIALRRASMAKPSGPPLDWAFDRPGEENPDEQDTLSLLVVHRGRIIHERYADGVDRDTRTRTWSTAKSIAVTLIGMLVDEGRMELDEPLPIDWLPERARAKRGPARGDHPAPCAADELRPLSRRQLGPRVRDRLGPVVLGRRQFGGRCARIAA